MQHASFLFTSILLIFWRSESYQCRSSMSLIEEMSRDWHITGSTRYEYAYFVGAYVEGSRRARPHLHDSICIHGLHALPSKNARLFGGSAIDARATRRRGLSSIINVGPAYMCGLSLYCCRVYFWSPTVQVTSSREEIYTPLVQLVYMNIQVPQRTISSISHNTF